MKTVREWVEAWIEANGHEKAMRKKSPVDKSRRIGYEYFKRDI